MPIGPHLQGHRFDAETVRLLSPVFETALVALQHADGVVSPTRDAVAQKIIELAKAGERDPDRLCDEAFKATLPTAPVLITDPSPLPPHASPPAQPDSLNFNQSGERPAVTRSQALRDNPFQTHLGRAGDRQAAVVLQMPR
jgi:hypothetical protein